MASAAHRLTEGTVHPDPRRERMLQEVNRVITTAERLRDRVLLYGADSESLPYAAFLNAVYDLTEIDGVYDEAQKIAWPLDGIDFCGKELGSPASREASAAWDLSK